MEALMDWEKDTNFMAIFTSPKHCPEEEADVEAAPTKVKNKCSVCEKDFKHQGTLKIHQKTAHDVHICPVCGKRWEKSVHSSALKRLKAHMKIHLKDRKSRQPALTQYKCSAPECPEAFSNLKRKTSHESKCGLMVWQCDRCQKVCPNKRELARHKNNNCPVIRIMNFPPSPTDPDCHDESTPIDNHEESSPGFS